MTTTIGHLMEANLLAVFNERDLQRRSAAIKEIYADDVQWIDDEGVVTGHDALNDKAAQLQAKLGELQFVKAGPVRQTRGLGFLAWQLTNPDGAVVGSGFDVAEIVDDRIRRFWTVLDTPE